MNIAQGYMMEMEHEAKKTVKLLERLPADKFGYKPHEKSMALSVLAGHVAEMPSWILDIVKDDELDFAKMEYTPPKPQSAQELVDLFNKNTEAAMALLKDTTNERLMGMWTLRNGEKVFFTLPRAVVIRDMVLNHIVHHRAQLTVYMRLLDVPVPGMYGPSADEGGMM